MTLPDPYRGHAAPSWDTRTLASLIGAMGGPGAAAPIASAGGGFPNTFADVELPGATSAQVIPFAAAAKINLYNKISDPGNNFSTSGNTYACPATGIYLCHGVIRVNDGQGSAAGGPNLGMGIHTSEDVAETSFLWHKLPNIASGSGRCMVEYTRVASFTSGSQLRLYAFWDSGSGAGSCGLYSARMQISRLG
jgi:hypothetical protein